MINRVVISKSPAETRALAAALLPELAPGAVLALYGELGSGKTCFVQGLAAALGIAAPVTSPTYTLVREYAGRRPLCHIDLYRLRAPGELDGLGLDEHLESSACTVIEWAERAADRLPASAWRLRFEMLPETDTRRITIAAGQCGCGGLSAPREAT